MASDVLAILVSDIHLSHRPPTARSAEPNWYEAMSRQLRELKALQKRHGCEVVCAGDIIDNWRVAQCPAELINFALGELPPMYSVAGNHDLPNHRLEDLRKSAYCTLMKAGVVKNLLPGQPVELDAKGVPLRLHGYPWSTEVRPRAKDATGALSIDVAVIHAYVWRAGAGHLHARQEDLSKNWRHRLLGYDVAHFGDNHCPVHIHKPGLTIFNPGTFFRRRIDEREHRPHVGLLMRDGTVEPHYLDVSQDKFLEPSEVVQAGLAASDTADFEGVVDLLVNLADSAADFKEAVRWALAELKPSELVEAFVSRALERKEKGKG